MKCPRKNCDHLAIDDRIYGIIPCRRCQEKDSIGRVGPRYEFASISKSNRIQTERDQHGKDLLQPFASDKPNPEFAKAYPKESVEYYKPEELNKL